MDTMNPFDAEMDGTIHCAVYFSSKIDTSQLPSDLLVLREPERHVKWGGVNVKYMSRVKGGGGSAGIRLILSTICIFGSARELTSEDMHSDRFGAILRGLCSAPSMSSSRELGP